MDPTMVTHFEENSTDSFTLHNESTLLPQMLSTGEGKVVPHNMELEVFSSQNMNPTMWYVVHITAVVSLSISIVASLWVIIYLHATGEEKSFWRRRISERLVVYIALSDLFYSTEHLIDHVYMLSKLEWPPDIMCAILGFFLQEFATSQSIIVLFTALNAFVLIVKERGIPTGKYDWALLTVSFGTPAVIGTVCGILGYLGPSEVWCLLDIRKENAAIVNHIYSSVFLIVFIADVIFYALVIHKIQKSSKMVQQFDSSAASNQKSQKQKNLSARAAKVMSVFVVAYILQWWSYIVYSMWVIFDSPNPEYLAVVVFFSNIGGVFNCLAYTVVRRIYTSGPARRSTTKRLSSTYNIDDRQRLRHTPETNEKKEEVSKMQVTKDTTVIINDASKDKENASENGHVNHAIDSSLPDEANHI